MTVKNNIDLSYYQLQTSITNNIGLITNDCLITNNIRLLNYQWELYILRIIYYELHQVKHIFVL